MLTCTLHVCMHACLFVSVAVCVYACMCACVFVRLGLPLSKMWSITENAFSHAYGVFLLLYITVI